MKITISQEGFEPISITVPDNDKCETKSQEGFFTTLGIITAVWFGLAILGMTASVVSMGIEDSKAKKMLKKAISQLTPEEKNKFIKIVKSDLNELVNAICKDVDINNKELLKQRYVYTRYADDIIISAKQKFDYKISINY